jgi:tetratricopeptide (TPR) repeat protein
LISCALGLLAQKKQAPDQVLTEEASMKAEMALIDGERYLILENYAKALELFRVAKEINPRDAAIHYKIAQILYQNKSFDEAIVSAERAIEIEPSNKFYYLLAADIQTERADLLSAQKLYETLLKMPGNEDYLLDLAAIFLYQGKDAKALEVLTRAQDHFGTNETLVREKQRILQKEGNIDQIIEEWKRLVKEESTEEGHVFVLVDLLITHGRLAEAELYLKEIQAGSTSANRAGLMLAEILKKQGKQTEALNAAKASLLSKEVAFELKGGILNDFLKSSDESSKPQLLALIKQIAAAHPSEYTAQAFAGDVCFQLGDKESALSYYLKSTRIIPDNFSVWQNILSLEAELNQYDSLQVHAEEAIEYFPNQAALYYFGGTAYLRKKNYSRAIQLLEMGKRYAQDNKLKSVFHGQLGDAYNGMKNYPKSDNAYEEALSLDPDNEHVLNNYSYFLSLRKANLDKALKMSSRLIQLKPDNGTYLDTHGWVLFTMGKYKEASQPLRRAAELKNDAATLEHYGDVLFKMGDEEEAVRQWELAAARKNASELVLKKIADRTYYE